jgi:hypothetical protein
MSDFPLVIQCGHEDQLPMEELFAAINQILMPKARALWEEWHQEGKLVEADGSWMWSTLMPEDSAPDDCETSPQPLAQDAGQGAK